ncbi:MAG TPA: DUF1501 domain-containing protein [Saprospiraceae bacterium]|nr:DUF1501 domain-containing protein [Saprospiraceae bacterium]
MVVNKFNRRDFLKMAAVVSAGLSTTGTSLFNLRNLGTFAAAGGSGDYKALVCLYLGGGADSFNMVVPRSGTEYQDYVNTRSNLALLTDDILPVSPLNISGIEYGFHPAMANMRSLFDQGKLCFVNNIGTLRAPTTQEAFFNEEVPLPLGLFSHSDQSNQWQTAIPSERQIKGWAGRISDLLLDSNPNQKVSMNISFNGTNTFQSSNGNVEFTVSNYGVTGLTGYGEMYEPSPWRSKAIDDMMARSYNDPFKDTYAGVFKQSLESSLEFQNALDAVPEFTTEFSDSYLSGSFKMIAKIIAAREKLGFKKQIFFIDYGGWDNHDELLENQRYLLSEVDNAIFEFHNVLQEIDMLNEVTTFSMSEFGRTLTSNGNGTDHAWGGNVFAMGGAVNGNRFYGDYPTLTLDSNLDIGGGVLIPTTASDLYFAELGLWFGVNPSDLTSVFPNLSNFYSPGSQSPLGFLNI